MLPKEHRHPGQVLSISETKKHIADPLWLTTKYDQRIIARWGDILNQIDDIDVRWLFSLYTSPIGLVKGVEEPVLDIGYRHSLHTPIRDHLGTFLDALVTVLGDKEAVVRLVNFSGYEQRHLLPDWHLDLLIKQEYGDEVTAVIPATIAPEEIGLDIYEIVPFQDMKVRLLWPFVLNSMRKGIKPSRHVVPVFDIYTEVEKIAYFTDMARLYLVSQLPVSIVQPYLHFLKDELRELSGIEYEVEVTNG